MSLVSIVTPTMPDRQQILLERCMPSVAQQTWDGEIEHVIVSDRNAILREELDGRYGSVRFVEINDSWRDGVRDRNTGALPWMIGSYLALGDYVGFLGDDDELLPDHVARHVTALEATRADFTISAVEFVVHGEPQYVIGDATFAHTHLDSDGIMCRARALRTATWRLDGTRNAGDADLVDDWRAAGLQGHFLGGPPTAIHHDGWAAR